ncbi:MAG: SurA N-terminal domain-containing protein [Chloroflexota bacterium]|nr:SurA N-terminal domain-containing protein [Dehalococcoidia bacterium]MDW8253948.1 SurA N-terminal domain-containing protein [Chloroflexota bacterium]
MQPTPTSSGFLSRLRNLFRRPEATKRRGNRYASRWERERRLQQLAIALSVVAILLVVAIPLFGYYREVVARGQEEIARVNGVGFKMDDYIRQLRYRQRQIDSQADLFNQFGGQQFAQQIASQRSVLPTQIVFDWVDDELVRQLAPKMGIVVTPEEVDAQLRKDLEPLPAPTPEPTMGPADPFATPTPQPTPTPVPAPFEERYRNVLSFSGLSDAEYREQVRTRLLRQKLEEKLKAEVPTSAEQVHLRGILLSQESEAREVLEQLRNGGSWEQLAAEKSLDSMSRDKAGDLGWVARGVKDLDFDKAAFGLTGSGIEGPFSTRLGYWVLQRLDGPQVRELDSETLETIRGNAFSRWLDEQKKNGQNVIEYRITSDRQLWAQDRIEKEKTAQQRRLAQQNR